MINIGASMSMIRAWDYFKLGFRKSKLDVAKQKYFKQMEGK